MSNRKDGDDIFSSAYDTLSFSTFHIRPAAKIFGNFTLIFAINSLTKPFKNDRIDRYGKYARIMVCTRCRFAAVGAELIYAEESNQEEFL